MSEKLNNKNDPKAKAIRLGTPTQLLIILGVIFIITLFISVGLWCVTFAHKMPAVKIVCGNHLNGLAKAMTVYANDDPLGKYPKPNKWCDLLLAADLISEKMFRCPASKAKEGQCSYAMNKNLIGMKASEVSGGVVLLFETYPSALSLLI